VRSEAHAAASEAPLAHAKSECAANKTEKKKTRKSRSKHAANHPAAGVLPQDVKADAPERAACPSPLNAQHFASDAAATLHHVHFSASKFRRCANPDGSAYQVRIERTRFLQGGLVDGAPVWSFSQKECQDISAKQTARDGSKKAPALSRCEKNALTIHRTITKAIKDKARANVSKSKVKADLHHVYFMACSLLYLSLLFIRSRVLVFCVCRLAPAPTLLSHILCPSFTWLGVWSYVLVIRLQTCAASAHRRHRSTSNR